ncbi:ATP-binding protein, partial [Clostridium sp.]
KKYNIKGVDCDIILKDAKFGIVDEKEELLDDVLVNNMILGIVKTISSNSSKYNLPPKSITISREVACEEIEKDIPIDNEQSFAIPYEPKYKYEEVFIEEASKKQILASLTISKYKSKLFDEWGLKGSFKNNRAVILNFYGPPGTGKSMMAEGIASYLKKQVINVNYAELESKFVGETPKNIRKVFEVAKENDAVIVFDEADSFLGKRLTNVSQSADYGVNITRSVMLMELERFEGVVIFTTNLLSNYDEAFKRRILANIEFKLPDKSGRKVIWDMHISDKLPLEECITAEILAEKYEILSGADIKDMLLYAAVLCIQREGVYINFEDFNDAYTYVIKRYEGGGKLKVTHERISDEQYKREMEEIEGR